MPYIKSFRIEGLAGNNNVATRLLNRDTNVFFGPNGGGKTSMLRILHSAMSHQADLVKGVPFKSSLIVMSTWVGEEFSYEIDKASFDSARNDNLGSMLLSKIRSKPEWLITPSRQRAWFHAYLPISRLYENPAPSDSGLWGSASSSEMDLESRFASNLLSTWKDYRRSLSQELNEIQEEGLARILERVLARTEKSTIAKIADSSTAYEAVSIFLNRRGVHGITPSADEFKKRYSQDSHFRGLVQEIEDVETKIAAANGPVEKFEQLIREMFIGGKNLTLNNDGIEIAMAGKELNLSALSSGEKQLLKILVETVNVGPSVMLIDEPELSMHVDWQKRLIPSMRMLNPHAQFIIATHSPEIMAEIPDSQVFHI